MNLKTVNFFFAHAKSVDHFINLIVANSNSVANAMLTSFIRFFDAYCIRTINENFNIFCRGHDITHSFNSNNKGNNSTCVLVIKTSVIGRLLRKEISNA